MLQKTQSMIEGLGSGIRVWRPKTGRVYPLPPISSLLSPCSSGAGAGLDKLSRQGKMME